MRLQGPKNPRVAVPMIGGGQWPFDAPLDAVECFRRIQVFRFRFDEFRRCGWHYGFNDRDCTATSFHRGWDETSGQLAERPRFVGNVNVIVGSYF